MCIRGSKSLKCFLLSEFEYLVTGKIRVECHLEKPLPGVLLPDCLLFARMHCQHQTSHSAQTHGESFLCVATVTLQDGALFGGETSYCVCLTIIWCVYTDIQCVCTDVQCVCTDIQCVYIHRCTVCIHRYTVCIHRYTVCIHRCAVCIHIYSVYT